LEWWFARFLTRYSNDVMRRMVTVVAAVPSVWSLQLAQLLRTRERAKQATPAQVDRYLATLYGFEVLIDDQTSARAWGFVLPFARRHNVSVYDAAYLELALRLQLPLATTDATLLRHAAAAGVPIYTP
jgi:predicted nucleic acid-binding protein